MPFDPLPLDTTTALRMTGREKLEALSMALRQPLPDGFRWDFQGVRTCALGLAVYMEMIGEPRLLGFSDAISEEFEIGDPEVASQIFSAPLFHPPLFLRGKAYNAAHQFLMRRVRPRHVAKRIDRYLARTA